MDEHEELERAVHRWRISESNHRENQEELVHLLRQKLNQFNMTELALLTNIKRTTLYYMMYKKSGKGGIHEQAS